MKRLQTAGLLLTLLVVAALGASAIWGVFGGARTDDARTGDVDTVERWIDGERPRVEVLNGSGVPGLARTATRVLRRQGFDVVFFGNAPGGARDTSEVIDRVGRAGDAERVAEALGIRQVRSDPDTALYLEATVIVGRDWAERAPADATESAAEP